MSGSKRTSSEREPSEEELDSLMADYMETDRGHKPVTSEDLARLADPQTKARLRELRSVVSMLDQASECTTPPGSDSLNNPIAGQQSAADCPERIGHFRIHKELGRGGCGVVFLATDEALGRQVALKVPRPEALVSGELRRRFLSEAKAAALVDHPNIVPVYQVCGDDPVCYIASAFCDGPTLVTWLNQQQGPVDPTVAANWVGSLADAVQHAHSRGVIHRDIKPGNVLLEPKRSDSAGSASAKTSGIEFVPKLTDFGLAKLQDGGTEVTRAGALMGTPSYMAPEQAEGRLEDIGPATDVYALGAILYELLTGKQPFRGENEPDTLRQVSTREPTPPARLRPDTPPDLAAICLKCLEKIPQARYASARAMADDIDRFLHGRATIARPIRWWQRGQRWVRRKPAAAALLAVSALAAATIGIGGWWLSVRYEHALETSRGQLYTSDVRLAYQAWQNRDTSQMIDLLSQHVPLAGETDYRSFPWYYLWRLCHGELRIFTGHRGDVYAVDFSPDDTTLATASQDGLVQLWDVANGQPLGQPIDHPNEVNHVRFSPDGNILATTCDDGYVRLWSHPGGRLLREFAAHVGVANVVDFAPDGGVFCTCGEDLEAKIWDAKTGKMIKALRGHTDSIETVYFSPKGTYIVTGADDATARLWDWPGGQELAVLDGPTNQVCAVAFAPDESVLATAGARTAEVQLWEVPTGNFIQTLDAVGVRARNLTWSADGSQLVATGDGETHIWNFTDGVLVGKRRGPAGHGWMSSFSSDSQLLATAGRDGKIRLWNCSTDLEFRCLPTREPVHAYSFSPDGRLLAVAHPDGTVNLTRIDNGSVVGTCRAAFRALVTEVVFSPDGNRLAIVTNEEKITICNARSGEVETTLEDGKQNFHALAFSPDGKRLVTGGKSGRVMIWSSTGADPIARLPECDDSIADLAFAPAGRKLAVASGLAVKIFAVDHWGEMATLPHSRLVRCVEFSPAGTLLVTAGDDNQATLWDCSTYQPVAKCTGHQDRIVSVAFSPQQKTLATAAGDQTLRLWDVATGQELIALPTVPSMRPVVAFSPEGRSLATNVWLSAKSKGVFLLDATPLDHNRWPNRELE